MSAARHARRWTWFKRVATLAFVLLVVSLVAWQARAVDWGGVAVALRAYSPATLLLAVLLAAASHALYSCFDLIGRRYSGHGLPTLTVLAVAFISYAFNLNLGATIGGGGMRLRLYSQLGLNAASIARVIGISLSTNWLGYMLLAALLFASGLVDAPAGWTHGEDAIKVIGMLLGLAVLAYLACCLVFADRVFALGPWRFALPGWRMALLQLAMSTLGWTLIGCIVHVLLQGATPFAHSVGALLLGAMAGAVTHVPGGLGVIEAVFVAMLGAELDTTRILAALLTYRAIYYLAPLLVATTLFIVFEMRVRTTRLRRRFARAA